MTLKVVTEQPTEDTDRVLIAVDEEGTVGIDTGTLDAHVARSLIGQAFVALCLPGSLEVE